MNIEIASEIAQERHAQECQEFLADLRVSKTKSKDTPEGEFVYAYSWSERIECDSFADIIGGNALARQQAERAKTVEEKIADRIQRSSVALTIKAGRVSKFYRISGYFPGEGNDRTGTPAPIEVISVIQKQETDRVAEFQRIENLTPEQRQVEIDEALGILRGQPGFFAFGMPK